MGVQETTILTETYCIIQTSDPVFSIILAFEIQP